MAFLIQRSDPHLHNHHHHHNNNNNNNNIIHHQHHHLNNNINNNNNNNNHHTTNNNNTRTSFHQQQQHEEQEMVFTISSPSTTTTTIESQKTCSAPPFLTKTYELVDDPRTNHIVSWGEDDSTFVVWRPPEFARDLLPNYFKHNNFSSFVRQLNTYGFKKVVTDRWEFANEYFKKWEKQLLCAIQRRKTPTYQNQINYLDQDLLLPPNYFNSTSSSHDENHEIWINNNNNNNNNIDHNNYNSPNKSNNIPSNDVLIALTEDNQRLRKRNIMLLSELNHMKTLYNDIIYFIQNHVKQQVPANNNIDNSNNNSTYNNYVMDNVNHSKIIDLDNHDDNTSKIKEQSKKIIKLFGVPLHSKKRVHLSEGN